MLEEKFQVQDWRGCGLVKLKIKDAPPPSACTLTISGLCSAVATQSIPSWYPVKIHSISPIEIIKIM